jgi:hypothetical protein
MTWPHRGTADEDASPPSPVTFRNLVVEQLWHLHGAHIYALIGNAQLIASRGEFGCFPRLVKISETSFTNCRSAAFTGDRGHHDSFPALYSQK